MQIPISQIIVPQNRKRQLGDITPLAESMSSVGLLNPVVLTKDDRLIAGLHRVMAAKSLGWDKIECRKIEATDLQAELAEIDENLIRNELTVLERSEHLARRKEIYEALHPQTKHGAVGRRGSGNGIKVSESEIISFSEDAASKTNTSRRTVEQEVKIARSLSESVKDQLRGTAVENRKADLLKLSRMNPEEQKRVADKIASGSKTVKNAKNELKAAEHKSAADSAARTLKSEEADGVHHGDFRKNGSDIPDSSVALIFTDPPYLRENLPLFDDLAIFADRVLVDGGSLVTFSGQCHLPEVIQSLSSKLRYFWITCCQHSGPSNRMHEYAVNNQWKPMLWFVKGSFRRDRETWVDDLIVSAKEKAHHPWQQSVIEAKHFISRLTQPGEFVVDPFSGSGTTSVAAKELGRRWWTCDIDAKYVQTSRERLKGVIGDCCEDAAA